MCAQVEQALQWSPDARANPRLYAVDYAELFVNTVREALKRAAPWLNFEDTSPSSGLASSEPYVKRCRLDLSLCVCQATQHI